MTIAIELLLLCAFLLGFVCIGLGYWWASANHRRTAGGKSVKELAEEKEAYQEQVVDHFKTTAELLNEMTDKYRDVYRHMAEGAQNLASTESAGPALAALQHGLLAAPKTATDADAVIDSEAETVASSNDNQEDVANRADSLEADAQSELENEAQPGQDTTEEQPQDETMESGSVEEEQETKEFFSDAENEQHEQIPPDNAEEGDQPKEPSKN